jgi:hypothetical protein
MWKKGSGAADRPCYAERAAAKFALLRPMLFDKMSFVPGRFIPHGCDGGRMTFFFEEFYEK